MLNHRVGLEKAMPGPVQNRRAFLAATAGAGCCALLGCGGGSNSAANSAANSAPLTTPNDTSQVPTAQPPAGATEVTQLSALAQAAVPSLQSRPETFLSAYAQVGSGEAATPLAYISALFG